jgi:hypothetical protein
MGFGTRPRRAIRAAFEPNQGANWPLGVNGIHNEETKATEENEGKAHTALAYGSIIALAYARAVCAFSPFVFVLFVSSL